MKTNFMRLVAGATIGLSLFAAASIAQASSLTSVQVSAIIGLLQSFGADSSTIANVQATLNGQATSGSTSSNPATPPTTSSNTSTPCVNLSVNLSVGSSNRDVVSLQQFLGVNSTGYFGSLTQQAVMRWQSAHGISTIGSVGPQTRAAMGCGSNQPMQPVSNTSGSTSGTPTATIDQSSLTASAGSVTLTGSVTGVNLVEVYLVRTDGYAYGDGTLGLNHGATLTNGHWSFTATSLPVGTYAVTVRLPDMPSGSLPAGATLTTGTLTVVPFY